MGFFDRGGGRLYNVRMFKDLKGFVEPGSRAESLIRELDAKRLPLHVAIIMDGNGRWAQARGWPRIKGHRAAIKTVREIVETAARTGIKVLSLFAFSSENWKRPRREVSALFRVLEQYLKKEDHILVENDLRLKVLGRRDGLPASLLREIDRAEKMSERHRRMTVGLALNYGSRDEIVDAVRSILRQGPPPPDEVDEKMIASRLYTAGLPDPDLLIRTSGEFRVSNFLLWQIAYAEIWITPVLWPDFRKEDFFQALLDYQNRERRFGDIRSSR